MGVGRAHAQTESGASSAALPTVKLPPELARVVTDYEIAWRAKDAAALSRLFAEDGFVLSPGEPMVRGRAAIEKLYQGVGGPLFLRAVAYKIDGSFGFIIGEFSNHAAGSDDGKFKLVLQKSAAGKWMIVPDMDNGNQPPTGR
jgi:ketosteroid isomerase-like protein